MSNCATEVTEYRWAGVTDRNMTTWINRYPGDKMYWLEYILSTGESYPLERVIHALSNRAQHVPFKYKL